VHSLLRHLVLADDSQVSARDPNFRKRLWQFAFAIGLFSLIVQLAVIHSSTTPLFYTAGQFVAHGQYDQLYTVQAAADFQRELSATVPIAQQGTAPFWNPPQFALPFALPFVVWASFSFHQALAVWIALLVACLVASLRLLGRLINHQEGWLLAALVLTAPVTLQALAHAQSSMLSLLIVTAACIATLKHRFFLAGLSVSLLWYKPQLAAVVTLILCILGTHRALLGLLVGASTQLALVLLVMPSTLGGFLLDMPEQLAAFQSDQPYAWHRHATLLAFVRQLLQSTDVGPTLPVVRHLTEFAAVGIALSLVVLGLRWKRKQPGEHRPILIASLFATPLIVPFYFDYDLLLMAVPAVLLASLHREGTIQIRAATLIVAALCVVLGGFDQSTIYAAGPAWLSHLNLRPLLLVALFATVYRDLMPRRGSQLQQHDAPAVFRRVDLHPTRLAA
jgi:Glycosyltransferase family 87